PPIAANVLDAQRKVLLKTSGHRQLLACPFGLCKCKGPRLDRKAWVNHVLREHPYDEQATDLVKQVMEAKLVAQCNKCHLFFEAAGISQHRSRCGANLKRATEALFHAAGHDLLEIMRGAWPQQCVGSRVSVCELLKLARHPLMQRSRYPSNATETKLMAATLSQLYWSAVHSDYTAEEREMGAKRAKHVRSDQFTRHAGRAVAIKASQSKALSFEEVAIVAVEDGLDVRGVFNLLQHGAQNLARRVAKKTMHLRSRHNMGMLLLLVVVLVVSWEKRKEKQATTGRITWCRPSDISITQQKCRRVRQGHDKTSINKSRKRDNVVRKRRHIKATIKNNGAQDTINISHEQRHGADGLSSRYAVSSHNGLRAWSKVTK
ncbi:uncharacterized protein MONBRDRAFT_13052, partial [Monosiga brevicollis MX1]